MNASVRVGCKMEVSLHDILNAREQRVRHQKALLTGYGVPLICFTMNIAGPVKTSPLIERGFRAGLKALDSRLPEEWVLHRDVAVADTGCEAIYAVSMAARELKELCTQIEEATPLGRLFDMDVLDTDGKKLERPNLRGCLVCGAPGRGCAAGRLHPVSQLQEVTEGILVSHFEKSDREKIAGLAVQSLLDEVFTTPKPGLVDRRNNGSHKDMDTGLFVTSALSLKPYFEECVWIGQKMKRLFPEEMFPLLRQAGLAAEQTMYRATDGINTHKGAIYTFGVLCGSLGRLWSATKPVGELADVLSLCTQLVENAVEADFSSIDTATAGGRLYLERGLRGIRGEVAAGLPSVASISLPVYKAGLKKGLAHNDAGAAALLHLIAAVEDTNLYRRGGEDGAAWAANTARELTETCPYPSAAQIESLDDAFIARNLSPGGCADLLAVTYFLYRLEQSFGKQCPSG